MLIPYRVDVPYDRRPVMNWLVFVALILVFAIQVAEQQKIEEQMLQQIEKHIAEGHSPKQAVELARESVFESTIYRFTLKGWEIKGLLGHMWLHAGIFHLIGNLIFLWLFGNAVCSKLGNIVYLPLYVGLGLAAGVSQLLFAGGPALGASGAINGIVGMFLVFFPENDISCLWIWFLWYGRTFTVRSFWMILLWFVFDICGAIWAGQGVAYFAHIGGFVAGAALAILMLKLKWLTMEPYEKSLLQLIGLERTETERKISRDIAHWQREWVSSEREKPEPKTIEPRTEEAEEDFIRFRCQCGKRIKAAREHAGKIGRCPKCSKRVKIPER